MLVPTAAVLWFMTAAMHNERFAVRQRLADAYRQQLLGQQSAPDVFWAKRLEEVAAIKADTAAQRFAATIRSTLADSVIIRGGDSYPQPASATSPRERPELAAVQMLEASSASQAANAYAEVAAETKDPNLQAAALQAQARCLLRTGEKAQAVSILDSLAAEKKYQFCIDPALAGSLLPTPCSWLPNCRTTRTALPRRRRQRHCINACLTMASRWWPPSAASEC